MEELWPQTRMCPEKFSAVSRMVLLRSRGKRVILYDLSILSMKTLDLSHVAEDSCWMTNWVFFSSSFLPLK